MVRAGLVGEQDAAGIVIDDVVGHRRMTNCGEMDALAAIEALAGFPWRNEGTTAGIGRNPVAPGCCPSHGFRQS